MILPPTEEVQEEGMWKDISALLFARLRVEENKRREKDAGTRDTSPENTYFPEPLHSYMRIKWFRRVSEEILGSHHSVYPSTPPLVLGRE